MKIFLIVLTFLLLPWSSFSVETQLIKIDFPVGMRNEAGVIQSNCQDYLGYIWIGQNNGLYRYDGYNYKKVPTFAESEFGISDNNIRCIFEDSDSLLWIGTRGGGLNCYDRKNDRFLIFTANPNKAGCISFNDISSIFEDADKVLWIGTNGGGLNRFDKSTQSFVQIIDPENSDESAIEKVLSICNGLKGELYIGTWENGLKKIDLKTGRWEQMFDDLSSFPLNSRRNIWSLSSLSQNEILLCTFGEGALVFNISTHHVSKLEGVYGSYVFTSRRNPDGTIFLGSEFGLEKIKNGKGEILGSSLEVRALSLDNSGNLWVGQQQELWALKKIPQFFNSQKEFSGLDCTTLYVDNHSFSWLALPGRLVRIDLENHSSKSFPIPDRITVNMISNWTNDILVLATSEGILFFNKSKGSLVQINDRSIEFTRFIRENGFFCTRLPDSSNWISTLGMLYYRRKGEEKYISEKLLPTFSMSHYVSTAIPDSDGSTWLGTFGGGLNHLSVDKKSVQPYKQTFVSNFGLSNNFIECLAWDRSHRLWIGTHDGLNVMKDVNSGKFETFTVKDGLPNNEINSMVTDLNGFLWIGTSNGLCRLNTENMEFRIFGIEDGLPSVQFLTHSAFLLKNGSILMGTRNGPVQFDPGNMPDDQFDPEVFIQSLYLFNEEIHPAKNSILKQNALFSKTIRLNYDQNYFGVSFTSLPYFRKENTSYAYKLVGVNQAWQFTKSNSINYTNLQSGAYILKIKSITGANSSKERTLQILIIPPWWKSKVAYWAYAVFFLIILLVGIYLLVKQERRKGQFRLQKYKRQKEKELNDLKFAFFSQVSNELKNPLTLIINPLREIAEQKKISNADWKNQLPILQSGAFQMKQILEQLVDFKKIGTGEYQSILSLGNVSALQRKICLKYLSCGKSGKKVFQFTITPDELFCSFDAGLFSKIHGNVLDYFFNRSIENSKIIFNSSVVYVNEKPFLLISVSDKLSELTALQLKLMIEPFSGGDSESPYGFGMAITNELVKLCKGNMRLANNDVGLKAEIHLPLILNSEKNKPENIFYQNELEKPALLIVIENTELRNYLAEFFSAEYLVFNFDLAEKAIAVIDENLPDMIICDYELKGIDGLQFYLQLIANQNTGSIPFILLNGNDDPSIKLQALNAGAYSFIVKPINVAELQAVVRNYFTSRENLKKELTSDIHSIQIRDVEITNPHKELLDRLLNFMEYNFSDPNLNVESLCAELEMSRPQVYRKLQVLTGLSVQEFIKSFRLKKAAAFLRAGDIRISGVAYQTGFSDPQHFSKSFKNQFGKSPTQYAAQHKG
jgi:ligand-binding sensor domain-containing protein/AraC-like DNA-binding protein/CheY-like chemotaxis protein